MKKIFQISFLVILFTHPSFSQNNSKSFKAKELSNPNFTHVEIKPTFDKYDFSALWTTTENQFVYGFIGSNYQRLRVKILSVVKDSTGNYNVHGRSMVKNNVCDFEGILIITNIYKQKYISAGLDKAFKNRGIIGSYTMVGDYTFKENVEQSHTGTFKGSFKTNFYVTKNRKIHYNDIDKVSDSFTNNDFVGTWTSYDNKTTKVCNWGDYRIPDSGDLDIGAGEFSPRDRYLLMGWQTVHDAYMSAANSSKAKKEETRKWWE